MTISTTSIKAGPFPGNDSTVNFPFTYKVFDEEDLRVVHTDSAEVETDEVLATDYTVNLNADQNSNPGGSVDYPVSGDPLATGDKLTVLNEPTYTQGQQLVNGSNWNPVVVENALDRNNTLVLRVQELASRGITLKVSSALAGLEMPDPEAGKYLYSIDGVSVEWVTSISTTGVSAFVATLLDDADGDAFLATLDDSVTSWDFTPPVEVGDPGLETTGININGVTYDTGLRVNDIGGTKEAQLVLHRHSTTLQPLIIGARTNDNTSSHTAVTAGQSVFSVFGAGYTGSHYDLFAAIDFLASADGTISATSSPGKITFSTVPDGSNTLAVALTIEHDKSVTLAGAARAKTTTDADGSFDMDVGNDFIWTPTGADTLEFTNEVIGHRG